jgi:hypothetical protein
MRHSAYSAPKGSHRRRRANLASTFSRWMVSLVLRPATIWNRGPLDEVQRHTARGFRRHIAGERSGLKGRSPTIFADRRDAGSKLAAALRIWAERSGCASHCRAAGSRWASRWRRRSPFQVEKAGCRAGVQVGRILTVVDGEGGIDPDLVGRFAQKPSADTVESSGPGQRVSQPSRFARSA